MNFFTFLLLLFLVFSCAKEHKTTMGQLKPLTGKWIHEEPVIEFYQWDKQDNNTYLGAKYSIIEGKDSLIELHSIQEIEDVIYYRIDKVDTDFPVSNEFQFVATNNHQHIFKRNDSVFPQRIILKVTDKQLTLTKEGQLNNENISLPIVYNKQQ